MNISPSPFAPENLAARDGFDSPVPRQPPHLQTHAKYGAYLPDFSRVPRRHLFIYYFKPPYAIGSVPRVYRVAQLGTDGVHCRESAGRRPVNLQVVPNGCCLGRSPWTNLYMPLFLIPTIIGMTCTLDWPCFFLLPALIGFHCLCLARLDNNMYTFVSTFGRYFFCLNGRSLSWMGLPRERWCCTRG